jgi:hypothetical protein
MNTSRRIEDLNPAFQPIVREVILRAESHGLYPFVTEGTRSREYQACLYASGRAPATGAMVFGGYRVETSLDAKRGVVIARCGNETTMRTIAGWKQIVTRVLDSWHTVGLAVDFGLRSARGATDNLAFTLEAAKQWSRLEDLYTWLHQVWLEVCPSVRWGNDWDGDGVRVGPDPDESLVDMPHWEWHPGRTLADVVAGRWPAAITQCPHCRNFNGTGHDDALGARCGACGDDECEPKAVTR